MAGWLPEHEIEARLFRQSSAYLDQGYHRVMALLNLFLVQERPYAEDMRLLAEQSGSALVKRLWREKQLRLPEI
jgi:hypothetical protein